MASSGTSVPFPPLRLSWQSAAALTVAVAGSNSLFGIEPEGKLMCFRASDGQIAWQTSDSYLIKRLVCQGSRAFAYRLNVGLTYVDDTASGPVETVAMSFGVAPGVNVSTPVLDGNMVYFAVNQGLYATHQQQGFRFGAILSEVVPHSVGLAQNGDVVTIDGRGIPTRYRVTSQGFEELWTGEFHGVADVPSEHPFVIEGDRMVLAVGGTLVGYDMVSGHVAWRLPNVPAQAFAAQNGVVYAAFNGASIWAINADTGSPLWQRQYVYDIGLQLQYDIAMGGDYIYFGGTLQHNPDGAILLGIRASDGRFAWISRAAGSDWAGGIPKAADSTLFVYGPHGVGAYRAPAQPLVPAGALTFTPNPVSGPESGFGSGTLTIDLPVRASVTALAYREAEGPGRSIVNHADWSSGSHAVSVPLGGNGGYSDRSQFGYIIVDITDSSGPTYTQAVLVPVNTFPDVLWHWARRYIEVMVYHKFIGGYPDQTFKPDNLVTRAESCTIVAKTLGLGAPSPGFKTQFTDIARHWAAPFIMALEERGVIGGFQEPDGAFTFRPDINMTRAQEARILVRAYTVPPAPSGFQTSFSDTVGHWARPDIEALEAAGYVNGYRESDGSTTYRPEKAVTRAELCTIVVRIQELGR